VHWDFQRKFGGRTKKNAISGCNPGWHRRKTDNPRAALAGPKTLKMNSEIRQFRATAQKFLERSWELFPHEASELGLHAYDAELGANGPDVHARHMRLLRETLRQVEALSDHAFAGDDWLDRRGFLSMLRTHLFFNETLGRWRDNPQLHCDAAMQSILGLVIRNTDNLRRVQPAIESRLARLPDFLGEGASCTRRPVPLWTKLAIKTCDGAQSFFDDVEKALLPLSREPEKTKRLLRDAAAAFKTYARSIAAKSRGPANGFSVGRDRFEFLIRERLGLPYSLAEAEALGERLIARLTAELKREAARFGRKPAAEIIERAAAEWQPASDSLLAEYERGTDLIKQRFVEAALLTLPERERLKVTPVPEFLRHHFPTAAYLQPGPFAKDQTGIFWVNDLSARHADPEKKRAEIRQHFGLELTCAHEAYPGHHVQFVIQNQHPSKLRRLFSHAIFYEGWTLWCEKMCVEHKIIESPYARLIQIHDALWRAYRIVIDSGLHSGRLTFRGACRKLVDGVGFTASRAEGDVNWYTSSPSVPMSYLLGRVELEKLHAKLVGENGWPLRKFNDWVLSFGAIPWSWIWQSQLR
jgi:uncharacterized protein DUF885